MTLSDETVDVAVVGMGVAGCVAAAEAHDAGASVAIYEAADEAEAGGNSRVSGQALWIAHPHQLEAVLAYQRALNEPNPVPEPVLRAWAEALVELEPWISAKAGEVGMRYARGMGWTRLETIVEFPELGAEAAVAYNATIHPNPSGVWRCFAAHVARRPAIAVRYGHRALRLFQDESGAVTGLEAQTAGGVHRVRARRAVILACGGYEADPRMHRDHWGAARIEPVGSPHNRGDGIRMLQRAGARLWHMRNFTQTSGNWPAIAVPGLRAAFLRSPVVAGRSWFEIGADHRRFHDEGRHHRLRHFHQLEFGHWQDTPHWRTLPVHMILDRAALEAGPIATSLMSWNPIVEGRVWSADNRDALERGWIISADSLEALAERIGRPAELLAAAVEAFNAAARGEVPCPFGRAAETMQPLAGPPWLAVELVPGVIATTGGGARDARARVLDHDDRPIPGLYEAGELGSIFSNLYQNGGFLTEAMIFGRIAGREAAARRT